MTPLKLRLLQRRQDKQLKQDPRAAVLRGYSKLLKMAWRDGVLDEHEIEDLREAREADGITGGGSG